MIKAKSWEVTMKTVVATFYKRDEAEKAISDLRTIGFNKDISIISKDKDNMNNHEGNKSNNQTTMTNNDSIVNGAITGGVLGGIAGWAIGAGMLAIPGLGPIIAAGPLAGLISGAATGGIAGGLVDWGIPAERSKYYEERVKKGEILVSLKADVEKINLAAAILRDNGAANVETH
jgi:uncharacterized membrane protein